MKNTKAQFEITEFEAFALHIHYREKAKVYRDKGDVFLFEAYSKNADKWLDIAIQIANN